MNDNTEYFGEDYQVTQLKTVGDFKGAGLVFVVGDLCENDHGLLIEDASASISAVTDQA